MLLMSTSKRTSETEKKRWPRPLLLASAFMKFSTRRRDKTHTEPSEDFDVDRWSSPRSRWLPHTVCFPTCAVPTPVPGSCQARLNMTLHTAHHNKQARTCVSRHVMSCSTMHGIFFFYSLFIPSCCIDYISGLCSPGEINSRITFVLW